MSLTSDARSAEPASRPNRLAFAANAVAGLSRMIRSGAFTAAPQGR